MVTGVKMKKSSRKEIDLSINLIPHYNVKNNFSKSIFKINDIGKNWLNFFKSVDLYQLDLNQLNPA